MQMVLEHYNMGCMRLGTKGMGMWNLGIYNAIRSEMDTGDKHFNMNYLVKHLITPQNLHIHNNRS
jgi:hypothetical protein